MDEMIFSNNWNEKLGNNYFTTIRLHNPEKYSIGKIFNVKLERNNIIELSFYVQIVDISIKKLRELTNYELIMDTGTEPQNAIHIIKSFYPFINYEHQDFDLILVKRSYEMWGIHG